MIPTTCSSSYIPEHSILGLDFSTESLLLRSDSTRSLKSIPEVLVRGTKVFPDAVFIDQRYESPASPERSAYERELKRLTEDDDSDIFTPVVKDSVKDLPPIPTEPSRPSSRASGTQWFESACESAYRLSRVPSRRSLADEFADAGEEVPEAELETDSEETDVSWTAALETTTVDLDRLLARTNGNGYDRQRAPFPPPRSRNSSFSGSVRRQASARSFVHASQVSPTPPRTPDQHPSIYRTVDHRHSIHFDRVSPKSPFSPIPHTSPTSTKRSTVSRFRSLRGFRSHRRNHGKGEPGIENLTVFPHATEADFPSPVPEAQNEPGPGSATSSSHSDNLFYQRPQTQNMGLHPPPKQNGKSRISLSNIFKKAPKVTECKDKPEVVHLIQPPPSKVTHIETSEEVRPNGDIVETTFARTTSRPSASRVSFASGISLISHGSHPSQGGSSPAMPSTPEQHVENIPPQLVSNDIPPIVTSSPPRERTVIKGQPLKGIKLIDYSTGKALPAEGPTVAPITYAPIGRSSLPSPINRKATSSPTPSNNSGSQAVSASGPAINIAVSINNVPVPVDSASTAPTVEVATGPAAVAAPASGQAASAPPPRAQPAAASALAPPAPARAPAATSVAAPPAATVAAPVAGAVAPTDPAQPPVPAPAAPKTKVTVNDDASVVVTTATTEQPEAAKGQKGKGKAQAATPSPAPPKAPVPPKASASAPVKEEEQGTTITIDQAKGTVEVKPTASPTPSPKNLVPGNAATSTAKTRAADGKTADSNKTHKSSASVPDRPKSPSPSVHSVDARVRRSLDGNEVHVPLTSHGDRDSASSKSSHESHVSHHHEKEKEKREKKKAHSVRSHQSKHSRSHSHSHSHSRHRSASGRRRDSSDTSPRPRTKSEHSKPDAGVLDSNERHPKRKVLNKIDLDSSDEEDGVEVSYNEGKDGVDIKIKAKIGGSSQTPKSKDPRDRPVPAGLMSREELKSRIQQAERLMRTNRRLSSEIDEQAYHPPPHPPHASFIPPRAYPLRPLYPFVPPPPVSAGMMPGLGYAGRLGGQYMMPARPPFPPHPY